MSNQTELPDVDYDKEMDRHYIPLSGGWEIQTKGKGSTFRIAHAGSGRRWMVLDDQLHDPLVALANAVREALARRAQPEGEEKCVICGSTEPRTGTCGSDDPRALCKAPAGKPDGEAPQAELPHAAALLYNALNDAYQSGVFCSDETAAVSAALAAYCRYRSTPAAQHAESGAPAASVKPWQERMSEHKTKWHRLPPPPEYFMREEIVELRAALAAQSQGAQATGEFRTCCDHPDCSTCAGRGGYYRIAAKAEAPTHCDPAEGFCAACREQERVYLAAQKAAASKKDSDA